MNIDPEYLFTVIGKLFVELQVSQQVIEELKQKLQVAEEKKEDEKTS